MKEIIEINIKLLLKNKISFEHYFTLYCIYNKNKSLLEQYVHERGVFDRQHFEDLVDLGYLLPIDSSITFQELKLTDKYYSDFELENELNHEKYFEELRSLYPKRVRGRALHTNLANVKKKYKELIDSEQKHKLVMECLKLYISDLTKTNKLEYMQQLPTWINQRSYEAYEDLVKQGNTVEKRGGFIDDV